MWEEGGGPYEESPMGDGDELKEPNKRRWAGESVVSAATARNTTLVAYNVPYWNPVRV